MDMVYAGGAGCRSRTRFAGEHQKVGPAIGLRLDRACSIPVVLGAHWLMPVGRENALVTLNVSDPAKPRETSRVAFPTDFAPHWLSKDPRSNRLVLGAELGGERGMYVLLVDPATGRVRMDPTVGSATRPGYLGFHRESWPHGSTGPAWAHAAVFLPPTE